MKGQNWIKKYKKKKQEISFVYFSNNNEKLTSINSRANGY